MLPGVPTPEASISGTGPADAALAVPAAAAWGDVRVVRLPVGVEPGRHFVFANAGTPDGRYLIGSVQRDGFGTTPGGAPGEAALYEVASGRVVKMARLQASTSQVLSAAADGDWVLWQESPDQAGWGWRLYAYSLSTRRVHELARAATSGGQAVPGPLGFVSAGHGIAVWGQAVGSGLKEGDVSNAVVQRLDLASGRVTTVARSAGSPALSWPWLAWEELSPGGEWRLVASNLETGQRSSVPAASEAIALCGASAVYGAADNHSLWLIDDLAGPSAAVQVARGADVADYLEWPTLNGRIVAWAQNDFSIVYDRAERRLVALPVAYGWSSSTVAGPNLVWAEESAATAGSDHPATFAVLDTSTLPVLP